MEFLHQGELTEAEFVIRMEAQFCQHYRRWRGHLDRVLRQEHRAGEKAFVDFAGQTVPVIDHTTATPSAPPS